MKKFIVIDLRTGKALYGVDENTILFSTIEGAEDFKKYFFKSAEDGIIVPIKL